MTQDDTTDRLDGADWDQIRYGLDEALIRLRDKDREALLLRFFEGRTIQEISSRLSLTEPATQKRITRALEKLRRLLARRGLTSTAGAFAAMLEGHASLAAPAGLANSVIGAVITLGSVGVGTLGSAEVALFRTVMGIKTKIGIVVVVAAYVGLIALQTYRQRSLRKELDGLEAENQL